MKFMLRITPIINPTIRHKIGRFLESLGASIIGTGQTMGAHPEEFCDISFEMLDPREEKDIDRYVLGFLFDEKKEFVLLTEKRRPDFLKGKFNGIGGMIEPGETEVEAMRREGFEEARVKPRWVYGGFISGHNPGKRAFECYVFFAYDNVIFEVQDLTDGYVKEEGKEPEPLGAYCWKEIMVREGYMQKLIPDARFLIPMGIDRGEYLFRVANFITR